MITVNFAGKYIISRGETKIYKKSAYSTVIYNFCGNLNVGCGKELSLCKNEFAVLNGNDDIVLNTEDEAEFYIIGLDHELNCGEKSLILSDTEDTPILSAVKEISLYFPREDFAAKNLSACLGEVINAYVALYGNVYADNGLIASVKQKINADFADPDFSLESFIEGLNRSKGYVRALFKKAYGITPTKYLAKARLEKARLMLSGADRFSYTVKQVAFSCGFSDQLYFCRQFKKAYGLSPSAYAHRFDKPKKQKLPLGTVVEGDI